MSVYQILYMEKIPASAVCNEAVKLAEKRKLYGLKGFVNGVLRTIVRKKEEISVPEKAEFIRWANVRYSMPEWIVEKWLSVYGEEVTEEILKTFLEEKNFLTLRMQYTNVSEQLFLESLERDGISVQKGVFFPYAYRISDYSVLENLEAYQKGFFAVQDESSMLVGEISGVKKGDFVIDLCAAPGGKSLHLADRLAGTGKVFAADVSPEKTARIFENISRCGFENVHVAVHDACVYDPSCERTFDVVIADVPCSGYGVIGKKPD